MIKSLNPKTEREKEKNENENENKKNKEALNKKGTLRVSIRIRKSVPRKREEKHLSIPMTHEDSK